MDPRCTKPLKKSLAAVWVASLLVQGCGGGAGGPDAPVSTANESPNGLVAQPEGVAPAPAPAPAPALTSGPTVENTSNNQSTVTDTVVGAMSETIGWVEPQGLALVNTSALSGWTFNSQKATSWNPGGISLRAYVDASSSISLSFDFGCSTDVIQLRQMDCRNVVAASSFLQNRIPAQLAGVVSLTLRNLDMAAEYAMRLTDTGGQTFQYPLQVRTIERSNPTQWTNVRVQLKNPSQYWGGANDGRPTGQFVSMSIVAAPRNSNSAVAGLNYPRGQLEIKEAKYLGVGPETYSLKDTAPVNRNGLLPSLSGRLIVAHNTFNLAQLQLARDAGFYGVRRDLYWDVVERNGAYSFFEFDNGAANLAALGMKVLWVLAYGHPDHGGAVPVSAADYSAYATYLTKVAAFGKSRSLLGYEVWNEPHLEGYWPNPDPVAYAKMLNTATSALRQVDPSAKISSGGVAIDDPSYLFSLAKTGSLANVSGVGIHPYRKDTFITQSPTYKRAYSAPEMYANDKIVTRQFLDSMGVAAPLWNTEAGFSTVFFLDPALYPDPLSSASRNRQAQLVLRQVLTQVALNEPLITVYRLQDKGFSSTDKEMNFGLIDAAGKPKPAYNAIKLFTSLVKDKNFDGPHTDVIPGLHVLRWSGGVDSSKVFCVWLDNNGEEIQVTLPAGVKKVLAWDGSVLVPQSIGATQVVTVREPAGPYYLIM